MNELHLSTFWFTLVILVVSCSAAQAQSSSPVPGAASIPRITRAAFFHLPSQGPISQSAIRVQAGPACGSSSACPGGGSGTCYCPAGGFCCMPDISSCCPNGTNCCSRNRICCSALAPIACGGGCYANHADVPQGCDYEVCGAPR
jgi:hypothetical protein